MVQRPNRVVQFLTMLVSIAYYGLLALGVVLMIGLPAAKLLAGNNPDWVIGVPVPVVSLDSDATVLTRWGEARLEVEAIRASLRLPVSALPSWLFTILWAYVAAAIALMLMFLHHLRRIFQRVRGGEPFDSKNALRLRWLGFLLLAFAVLNGVTESVTAWAIRGALMSDRVEVPIGFSVDGSAVLSALVLLALAETFRRGAELQEEQSLTV